MKKLFYLIVVLVFAACQTGNKNVKEAKIGTEPVSHVEAIINIGGMHCENCVASVEKGVKALEGIESVVVSLNDSTAVVSFDASKTELTQIEEAIKSRGYTIKSGM